ncbi:MAG: lysylphosphatidylglycerol synthase transmembrane domain-containing protein [Anaerolineae bacterium]
MAKYRRLLVIGLVLGLIAFIAVTLLSDVNALIRYATTYPWWVVLPVIGLRAINWMLRFVKWHFYLKLVGVPHISLRDSAAVYFSGYPLAISPGKAAEILKSFILQGMTGAPVATTLPVVASERLSDGMAVLLLISGSILALAANEYWSVVYLSLGAMLIGIVILQWRPLCLVLLRFLKRLPLIGRLAGSFALFYESSYRIVQLPNLIIAVGLGLVANFLDGIGVYLLLLGLGLPASSELFFQAHLVISLSVVAGALSGMPGSIGASDLTITGTLQHLVGLSVPMAGFATLLIRFIQLWIGVFFGGVVAILNRKRLFTRGVHEAVGDHAAQPREIQAVSGVMMPQVE